MEAISESKTPLRALREKRGLTLQQVSAQTGIDTGNLSRIETGQQRCSIDRAEELVKFYGKRAITAWEIIYPERHPVRAA